MMTNETTERNDNRTQHFVHCGIYCQNSFGGVGLTELPQIFMRGSTHHWSSVWGGILLSSHGTLNPQQPPFELPEQQQGALGTQESQRCKHRLVLDPPLRKLNVAQGSWGFAVRCDLGRKTWHSVWLRSTDGCDAICLMLMTSTNKKQKVCLLTAWSEDVRDGPSQSLRQSLVCSQAQPAALCRVLRSGFMTLNSELNARKTKWQTEERKVERCVVD